MIGELQGVAFQDSLAELTRAVEELKRIRERTGISIMGEGGEYESMTLYIPGFTHAFEIAEAEKEWKRNDGTLRVKSLRPVH